MTDEPDASRPLKHVESAVAWILEHLSAEDQAEFESELPRWAATAADANADADAAVRELRDWLGHWIDRAREGE
jgi:hypothetical protein